jgi:hypothetical protein
MRQLRDRAAHGRIVGPLDNLIQFRQTEAANHLLVRFRRRNETSVILNANLAICRATVGFVISTLSFGGFAFCFSRHNTSSMENDKW